VALLALEVVTGVDTVAFFWDTTDEVVDESGVTDDLVTMEDVVVEDDAFTVAVDFVATETGVSTGFVVTGGTGFGWRVTMRFGIGLGGASLGAAIHDEMSEEIRSAIVSTTSVDENE
jgi:hypothetical protein